MRPLFTRRFITRLEAEGLLEADYKDQKISPCLRKRTIRRLIHRISGKVGVHRNIWKTTGLNLPQGRNSLLVANDPLFGELSAYIQVSAMKSLVDPRLESREAWPIMPMISVFDILRGTIAKHDEVKVYIQGFARAKDGTGEWNST
jgi:hypothetical protein